MARKRNKKKKSFAGKEARYARVAASWREASGRYLKWLAVFAVITTGLFLYNLFGNPSAGILRVTSPAFEAARICTAASALAVMAGMLLGRMADKGRAGN